MSARATTLVGCLVLLACTACGDRDGGGAGGADPGRGPDAPAATGAWARSTDPVDPSGLVWAGGETVHLGDGATVTLPAPPKAYVVAGDGVFSFPAEDADDVADPDIAQRELVFTGADGESVDTGLTWMTRSLRASPDGR